MRKTAWIACIVLLLLTLTSCGNSVSEDSDPLDGTSWELFAYRKSKPILGTIFTAAFEDGEIIGTGGCNFYRGTYRINGVDITIADIQLTTKGCLEPEGVMEQELFLVQFLGDAQTYSFEDERLLMVRADGEALTFDPME
ncbi:MAG: META domain-containing protein [Anaerolineales bacterium]|nr:META domain-containing protein [Anaerolineales bacterium]